MLTEASPETGTSLLEQRFRYDYAAPVRRLRHRLVVVPRARHAGQHRLDHGLSVLGSPVRVTTGSDGFGNHVVEVRATSVREWIEFKVWALVGERAHDGVATLAPTAAGDTRLLSSTPLTHADAGLAEAARELASTGARGMELAERACAWTHDALTYTPGVTNVYTTAADAAGTRQGVCQDYAHVMLALCRASGFPARYVSGHLVGEGGSHAWVEVVVPASSGGHSGHSVAVAFDPTHNRRARRGYLTVAVGRDYADVAPTSGTFVGTCPGVLTSSKRLRPAPGVGDVLGYCGR
jgi:transglutaminase-like putative cysteine protease